MKLIECYIENFGKICKQKFTFKDGLNCIRRDNGEGKTTLSVFIKVMLFGMGDTKKTSLYENDRRRYLPWQGGVCGGYLIFSIGKRSYRIERTFAAKAADDTFALYDTDTGLICGDFSENLGEELFGIDADGFERTVFLSERNLSAKSENKSISAKLSDLVGTDGDIGVMDEAMKVLEEQRKFYQKRGGSGKISDLRNRITETEIKLGELSRLEAEMAEADAEADKLNAEMRALGEQAAILTAKRTEALLRRSQADSLERYKQIQGELDRLVGRKDELIAFFGGEAPSHAEIDEANLGYLRAKQLADTTEADSRDDEKYAELHAIFGQSAQNLPSPALLRAARERVKEAELSADGDEAMRFRELFKKRVPEKCEVEAAIAARSAKARHSVRATIFVAAAVLLAAAIAGGILVTPLFYIGAAAAVALGAFAALKPKAPDEAEQFLLSVCEDLPPRGEQISVLLEMNRLLSSATAEARRADDDNLMLCEFAGHFGCDGEAEIDSLIEKYEKYDSLRLAAGYRSEKRQTALAEAARLAEQSDAFLSRFKTETDAPFAEIRRAINEYTEITAKIVAYRGELENRSLPLSEDGDAKETVEQIDGKRRAIEDAREELQRKLGAVLKRRDECELTLMDRDSLTAQSAELKESLADAEAALRTVLLTQKYLTAAKDSITAKYLGKTKESFEKYTRLIGGEEGDFSMDTSFGVSKLDGGASRATDAYSRGVRELYALAARLALTDSLYDGEAPFVIFDDPFCAFDDERIGRALELLQRLGKEKQIIYFTCSSSRAPK